jgi:uncharacterized membrane protein YccC
VPSDRNPVAATPSMTVIGELLGLDRAGLGHALRLAGAAILAFAIATLLHIENPYWAAMPVWVVSQAAKGLMLERAFFRLVGTLVGAAVGFAIVRLGLPPLLSLLVLGLWVGAGTGLVHMLRGVHGYGALLAGMTAAVVVLPSVLRPDHAAALAAARVECTLIGVLVVTLVTGYWTPDAPRQAFYQRVRRLGSDAVAFAAALETDEADGLERRILGEMSEIEANASLITAGSVEGYRRLNHVHGLVTAALEVMAAARARDQRLRRNRAPDEARLTAALERLARAERAFDREPDAADARSFGSKASYLAPQRDSRQAFDAGAIAGLSTFLAGLLGYLSGWPQGELAALGVCIFSMVLGSMPTPRLVAPVIFKGACIGVLVALFYRFTLQPLITTPTALIASMAPFMVVGGLARASRRSAGPALDANMCFLLASQAVLPAMTDRATILNEAAALTLAVGVVTSGFMLVPHRPERRALRAAGAVRTDLQRMARLPAPADPAMRQRGLARQILRLGLHLERVVPLGTEPGWSLLAALNLGDTIGAIQARLAAPGEDPRTAAELSAVLAALDNAAADPVHTALDLEARAARLPDPAAAELLRDAAAALKASRSLLSSGDRKGRDGRST